MILVDVGIKMDRKDVPIISNRVTKTLVISLFLLFLVFALSTILITLLLLWSIPDIGFSDIFEFSLIILNLVATSALITISWLLYNIERKRDATQANLGQKYEWRSIVNQLHERIHLVNEEIDRAQFVHSNPNVKPTIRKILQQYLLIKSHLKKLDGLLEELKGDRLESQARTKNRRKSKGKSIIRKIFDYYMEEYQEYQRRRRISVKKAQQRIKTTLYYLEQNKMKDAEEEFKVFSDEHYELTTFALDYYDLYIFDFY